MELFFIIFKNNCGLIRFFVNHWKLQSSAVGKKALYVAFDEIRILFTGNGYQQVAALQSNQEEADTRMLFHMKSEVERGKMELVVHTPDTDKLVLCLGHSRDIGSTIYFHTGVGDKERTMSIPEIKEKLQLQLGNSDTTVSIDDLCRALIGLHAFTGCDSVSAFAGKGKKRLFKLLMKLQDYIETFQMLGQSWNLDDDVIERLEKFTCHMYGSSLTTSVNELRYKIYCTKKGKITCEDLPPCHSRFLQHCNRANYQSYIWHSALEGWVVNQSPVGHGWKLDDDGLLEIEWMT